MNSVLRNVLLGLGTSWLLAACGGGSDSGGEGGATVPAARPKAQAVATPDTVMAGASVTLQGSGLAAAGGELAYAWRLIGKPEGSQAEISDYASETATVVTDKPGAYTASLTVTEAGVASDPSHVDFRAKNPNPVAVVIPAVSGQPGQLIQLDGTKSVPPDDASAEGLSFLWTLSKRPDGSDAELDVPSDAQPRFKADQAGEYEATLVVSHGTKRSEAAVVIISISKPNVLPVAHAGEAQTVLRGTKVTLDGSGSHDDDGDPLQYRWRLTNAPLASRAVLQNADTVAPSFTPDATGAYTFSLSVYDGTARSARASTVVINAETPPNAPNTKPVSAFAAPDGLPTRDIPEGASFQVELGGRLWLAQTMGSYDLDGDKLTTEWKLLQHPIDFDPAGFTVFASGSAQLSNATKGEYVIQRRDFDGKEWSDPVTQTYDFKTGANRRPTAVAKVASGGSSMLINRTVTLDAMDSSDPDDNKLSYHWVLLDKPNHSRAQLEKADSANPTMLIDQPGPYTVALVVTDENGWSSRPAELSIMGKSHNNPPIFRPVVRGLGIDLNGYDPDGDELTYLLVVEQAPDMASLEPRNVRCDRYGAGRAGTYSNYKDGVATCTGVPRIYFNGDITRQYEGAEPDVVIAPGDYKVSVSVSDGVDIVDAVSLSFTAVNNLYCQPLKGSSVQAIVVVNKDNVCKPE